MYVHSLNSLWISAIYFTKSGSRGTVGVGAGAAVTISTSVVQLRSEATDIAVHTTQVKKPVELLLKSLKRRANNYGRH